MSKLKMAAPWVEYCRQIEALFGKDPEIRITYDEDDGEIRMLVDNTDKAAALEKLLPAEKTFGNVTVRTIIVPANLEEKNRAGLIETAFKGNPVLRYARTIEGVFTNPVSYIVFKNEVVQYPIDNLHDINGNRSTLYETIANEVIGEDEGVCFCTDKSPWMEF